MPEGSARRLICDAAVDDVDEGCAAVGACLRYAAARRSAEIIVSRVRRGAPIHAFEALIARPTALVTPVADVVTVIQTALQACGLTLMPIRERLGLRHVRHGMSGQGMHTDTGEFGAATNVLRSRKVKLQCRIKSQQCLAEHAI